MANRAGHMTEHEAMQIISPGQVALIPQPQEPDVAVVETPDGLFLKEIYFGEPGTFMGQHGHQYAHAHLVGSGAMRVWIDDDTFRDFDAGQIINIEAGKLHTFMSLKPETRGFCIHNTAPITVVEARFQA